MSRRADQVGSLIQKELGQMLAKLELPSLTTISKIEVTDDLKWAKVGVTILDNKMEKVVLNTLHENIYRMQGELIRKLKMKVVPRITFYLDKAEEYAAHINELLRKVKEDYESAEH